MKLSDPDQETIAAIATAPGKSALAIVRLSGPKTVEILSSVIFLKNNQSLKELPAQKIALGNFHNNGEVIDEITLSLFFAPHSYTGEDLAEIYCHGSFAVLREIISTLLQQGARTAKPGEFTQRAFLNGKMDLAQAEAVANLIRSQTALSRKTALSQLEGRLSNKLSLMRQKLIETLSSIEVSIDHSDDPTSGTFIDKNTLEENLNKMILELENLIQSYQVGKLIQDGVKIAIAGKPNVGKSSLLNSFLKCERAIVTEIPGTTRDTLEEAFDLFGLPAILVDTAGIREHAFDAVEKIGMERTQQTIEKSDVVLLLLDQSKPLSKEDERILHLIEDKEKVMLLLNKDDLPRKLDVPSLQKRFPQRKLLSLSTKEIRGIEPILKELYHLALAAECATEKIPEILITCERHSQALSFGKKSLEEALEACRKNDGEECVAQEIRLCSNALGEIVGEITTEDLLGAIFSKFCIGK